ncbi:MAG TPA: response regulator transcription factor [Bacteroides sp.]|nr:response regulator transcription factor [Bacteroides sp.]
MKRVNFILCIEAYLLCKGVAAVLQRIPGASVVREFGTVDMLTHYLKNHAVDFLLICDTLFEKATDLFIEDPGLLERTILLKINPVRPEGAGKFKEIIYLTDGKQEITFKIKELLNPYFRNHREEPQSTLTEREKTIVRLVSMGLTNKQIADKLFLSTHTIITHRKNIIHKLGIKSVSGLTVYAIVNNIITIDEVT